MAIINRREFLKNSGAAAAFAATPGLAYSQVIGGGAPFDDYRALVCVFLFGGNDSFNMLVPRSAAEYGVYAASRQNLAIAQDELLPITTPGTGTTLYGVHPAMASLQQLFEAGSVAALERKAVDLLRHRDGWQHLREAGRQFVESERNWAASVARYADVYAAALRPGG
mgnify:CR=1 FL=1